ncbi:hypothetical protein GCM10009092_34950 [Bowmanella denitrificans]|uniref:Serine protease n=1 Tax=Bowmanella denitrificans TaxID=366582 RepID=A0ABN0XM29_9ALTE
MLLRALSLTALLFLSACNSSSGPSPGHPPPTDDGLKALTLSQADSYSESVEKILEADDSNLAKLLERVRGRVGTFRSGSISIIGTNSETGLGFYASANHVFGLSSWLDFAEGHIEDFYGQGIYATSHIVAHSGEINLWDMNTANFPLYHADISADAQNTTIVPAEDFYLGLVDSQTIPVSNLAQYPEDINTQTPVSLYDPDQVLSTNTTWTQAQSGIKVLALGYPQDTVSYPYGRASVGSILTDQAAEQAILALKAQGDEEGNIPYNAQVEFIANFPAQAGMSGGSVFDEKGRLLGVMVRSTATQDASYTRVVRISYIRERFQHYYQTLSADQKAHLQQFVDSSFL